MQNYTAKLALSSVALLFAANIHADVSLTLNNPNNGGGNAAYCSYAGLNASVNGVHDINGGEWIGIYSFNVGLNPVPNVTSPYYSICLSPGGDLDANTHTYNQKTPPATGSEVNPGGWTSTGFNNAATLFSQYASAIEHTAGDAALDGNASEQGTALAMALYAALWNSTGVGVVALNGTATSGFYLSGGGYMGTGFADKNEYDDYTLMLKDLTAAEVNGNPSSTVLVPDNPNGAGSGQEFMLLGNQVEGSPVPEASTVISGLLMLLPFGAGLIRVLRKKAV